MRIAHCIYNLDSGGGAENLIIDIVNKMALYNDVELIIINAVYDDEMLSKISNRVKVITLNRKPGSRSIIPIVRLNYELLRFRAQVVHCHNYSIPAYILPWAGRELFYTIHALNISMKYSGRAKCLFAITDAVKEDAQKRTSSKIITIPNGINLDMISIKKTYDFDGTRPLRVVNVGRLEHDKKGQDILINAVCRLKEMNVIVNVDFIGEGASRDYLQNMVAELGLDEQISFLGLKDRNYIYSHLKEYDLMCHPARYEGFGLTVAEGMAAGLPILVPDQGGPYELINKGNLGIVFENENVDDCARMLRKIIQDYQNYIRIVPESREKVEKEYSLDAMVSKYLYEYKNNVQ